MATQVVPPFAVRLEAELQHLYETTIPNRAVLWARSDLIIRVQNAISMRYGSQYRVECFGSTSYGVSGASSDLDLAIVDQDRPDGFAPDVSMDYLPYIYNPGNLARTLTNAGFKDVIPIRAAVPIVKFTDPKWNIQCDINTNEQFGIRNSRLLKAYLDLTPVGRPLAVALKRWAKRRGLNDPAGNDGPTTLSSYSLTLLLLAYLQAIGHLPNLQSPDLISQTRTPPTYLWARPKVNKSKKGKGKREKQVEKAEAAPPPRVCCNTTFVAHPPYDARAHTDLSMAATLLGFFHFYAGKESGGLDYEHDVVSLAEGGIVPRVEGFKEPPPRPAKEKRTKQKRGKGKQVDTATVADGGERLNINEDVAVAGAHDEKTEALETFEGDAEVEVQEDKRNTPMGSPAIRDRALGHASQTLAGDPTASETRSGETTLFAAERAPVDVQHSAIAELPVPGVPDVIQDEVDDDTTEVEENEGDGDAVEGDQQPRVWKEHLLVIQDPFIRARNTSQNIRPATVRHIVTEFSRARDILLANGSFDEVCAQTNAPINGEAPIRKKPKPMQPKPPQPRPAPQVPRDVRPLSANDAQAPRPMNRAAPSRPADRAIVSLARPSAREAARQSIPAFNLDALLAEPDERAPVPSARGGQHREGHRSVPGQYDRGGGKRDNDAGNAAQEIKEDKRSHPLYLDAQSITSAECFIIGITDIISESGLYVELSARFGKVKRVDMLRNDGYARVEFDTVDSAKKAIVASLPRNAGGQGPGVKVKADNGLQVKVQIHSKVRRARQPPRVTTADNGPTTSHLRE